MEAQRIESRTNFDLEMMRETGYCSGIENYSRYLDGRDAGTTPYTLLDYFEDDFLLFVDESHITLPQVRAMYGGDQSRKRTLVDFGFNINSSNLLFGSKIPGVSTKIICPKCQIELESTAKFCGECGSQIFNSNKE